MTCTFYLFFFNDTATTEIYTLSLQRRSSDLYPSASYFAFLEARTDNVEERAYGIQNRMNEAMFFWEDFDQEDLDTPLNYWRSEEHTSELQSRQYLVCRLLLEKKKTCASPTSL